MANIGNQLQTTSGGKPTPSIKPNPGVQIGPNTMGTGKLLPTAIALKGKAKTVTPDPRSR